MADFTHQLTHIYFCPTVADMGAPTVAEVVTAGALVAKMTNFSTPFNQAAVDTSDTRSAFDTSIGGTTSAGPLVLTLKRDDTDESDGWDLFQLRDTGFIVVDRRGPFTAADPVEVYPVEVGQRLPAGFTKNAVVTFDVNFFVSEAPELDAVAAA